MQLKQSFEVLAGSNLESIRNRILLEFENEAIKAATEGRLEFDYQLVPTDIDFIDFIIDSAVAAKYKFVVYSQSIPSSNCFITFSFPHSQK